MAQSVPIRVHVRARGAIGLLDALVEKFCDGSFELAAHYASCATCHVYGVAVDHECDAGKALTDRVWSERPRG